MGILKLHYAVIFENLQFYLQVAVGSICPDLLDFIWLLFCTNIRCNLLLQTANSAHIWYNALADLR